MDRFVLAFAGAMCLLSMALSQLHSIYWLWFTAFVGVSVLQSAFTGFCLLATILQKLGLGLGRRLIKHQSGERAEV